MRGLIFCLGAIAMALLLAYWARVWWMERHATPTLVEDGLPDSEHDFDEWRGI